MFFLLWNTTLSIMQAIIKSEIKDEINGCPPICSALNNGSVVRL